VPIRDNVFELRLYDAIADCEISSPALEAKEAEPYTWPGIVLESAELKKSNDCCGLGNREFIMMLLCAESVKPEVVPPMD
jgi:hypothetical protein